MLVSRLSGPASEVACSLGDCTVVVSEVSDSAPVNHQQELNKGVDTVVDDVSLSCLVPSVIAHLLC